MSKPPSLRPFFVLWSGQAVSLFGSQLVQFALIWWLTQKTDSATVLATAALVGLLPQVLLGPAIGVLVDRWDRRRILLYSDGVIALASLALALLFAAGLASIWSIYLILLVRAIGSSFHGPTMTASTALLVPQDKLVRVQGLNQTLNGALNILSPIAGALLLNLFALEYILLLDVFTALCGMAPLLFIAIPQPAQQQAQQTAAKSWRRDFAAGLAYLRGQPGLLLLIMMISLVNFLVAPAFTLTPLLVTRHFGGQVLQLAWLQTAVGAGTLAGGLLLGAWGGFKRRIATSMCGLVGIGLGILAIGLAPASMLSLAIAALAVVGFMSTLTNGPIVAILQNRVPPAYQGRIFSLLHSLAVGAAPLGLLLAGPLSDILGIQAWYIAAGFMCLLMGTLGFLLPAVYRIEETAETETDPIAAARP